MVRRRLFLSGRAVARRASSGLWKKRKKNRRLVSFSQILGYTGARGDGGWVRGVRLLAPAQNPYKNKKKAGRANVLCLSVRHGCWWGGRVSLGVLTLSCLNLFFLPSLRSLDLVQEESVEIGRCGGGGKG